MENPETPCLRWRKHRSTYAPRGPVIQTDRYHVEVLDHMSARAFVEEHHYSRSFPAARLCVGLFRRNGPLLHRLVGVAVYSHPAQRKALPRWLGVPVSPKPGDREGVELGRFVLLDDVPANGETWFLARAQRVLLEQLPYVDAVLSYSDPVPRTTLGGEPVMPGHVGVIYKAHNGAYHGQGSPRTLILDRWGRVVSERAMSKIRNQERGWEGALERMVSMGAPRRDAGESPRSWVTRARKCGAFRSMRHPGNHIYTWNLRGPDMRPTERPPRPVAISPPRLLKVRGT